MDDALNLPPNSLLIFIDETGNEDLSDPNNPTFGRGGCGALFTEYKHRISKLWKRLKRERLGGAKKLFTDDYFAGSTRGSSCLAMSPAPESEM